MKKNRRPKKGPVEFGVNSQKSLTKIKRQPMNSELSYKKGEPRTVTLSRSNFEGCIEQLLRATDVIKDSETPEYMLLSFDGMSSVKVTIKFKEEEATRPM